MATIDTLAIDHHCGPEHLWAQVAAHTRDWLARHAVAAIDACLLVPFAELLPSARLAFARTPGWMPRIHTTQTLARECAPPGSVDEEGTGPTGDAAWDELMATRLLRQQGWADAWARGDRPAFAHAVARLVRTAHLLMQGAAALPPAQRPSFWERSRLAVGAPGPIVADRALLRMAVEWAAVSGESASDPLFDLHPPAWIVVECGGQDALSTNLLAAAAQSGHPGLCLRVDSIDGDPFDTLPRGAQVDLVHAADGEEEAATAAFEVLQAVSRGATPVALITEDRGLVRRVRALLERAGTMIDDETGWSLATTRAGAHAFTALRAAHPAANQDDWLDWLKSRAEPGEDQTLAALEASWRGSCAVGAAHQAAVDTMWARERARLVAFSAPRNQSLARWLLALDELLFGAGTTSSWRTDPAMVQLRSELRLDQRSHDPALSSAFSQLLTLDEFAAWVDRCLEGARFVPPGGDTGAQVVLTPLSRAIARPFATVVLPGADERRLAADGPHDLLLGEAALQALGLPGRQARQRRQALAFVQLLRVPRLLLVRRRADGDEMLSPSPLVDRLMLARQGDAARAVQERDATLPRRTVPVRVPPRPRPVAAGHLPRSWSASAAEALRQCPYRFFARGVLRLKEQDELDDEVDKRDYGRWLHATLEQFHVARAAPATREQDMAHLQQVARRVLRRMTDAGEFAESALLPYWAGFDAFAARYVSWLHGHDAQGWRFDAGEVDRRLVGTDPGGLHLHGRIDRVDRMGRHAVMLIDYKTSARANLTQKVAQPLEDTQLAVYGALMLDGLPPDTALSAAYLGLDDADAVSEVRHPNVAESARCLLHALAAERERIDAGAALLALGQGPVCDTCEARGLCRRDHWALQPWEAA